MGVLSALEPQSVFRFFEEICSIPHGSYNTDKITAYCVDFAKERGLWVRSDEVGNVIIKKPATAGYEDRPTVIFQGHLDMVAVKEPDCELDMQKDGLRLMTDGKEVSAEGTSLGGDDGIAVAYGLALLDAKDIAHPALEVVLTVNEEVGMLGADALDCSDLEGRIFLNADSEEEGIFLTSCAGGNRVTFHYETRFVETEGIRLTLTVDGLQGGHSGVEIHKGRANANVLLGRVLLKLSEAAAYGVSCFAGGEMDNAICNAASATLTAAKEDIPALQEAFLALKTEIAHEYAATEPTMQMTLEEGKEGTYKVLHPSVASAVVLTLVHMPNGVQRMEPEMPGMVRTSLNIGILEQDEEEIQLHYAMRSSSESEKHWLEARAESLAMLFGGEVTVSGDYPGWEYRPDSHVREVICRVYEQQTGKKPVVCGIHAGLECGIFASKLPGLDCVSFGPQMVDIHTTKEKLYVDSVQRSWELLKEVLKEI